MLHRLGSLCRALLHPVARQNVDDANEVDLSTLAICQTRRETSLPDVTFAEPKLWSKSEVSAQRRTKSESMEMIYSPY